MLTFVPVEEIEEMEKTLEGAEYNKAKELLAYELTKLVHGEAEASKAKEASKALFGGNSSNENMPTVEIDSADFNDSTIGLLNLVVKAGLATSVSEAGTKVSIFRHFITSVSATFLQYWKNS